MDIALLAGAAILLGGFFWFSIDILLNSTRFRVPYVSSPVRKLAPILDEIISVYVPTPNNVVFVEPGAGLGYVSAYIAKQHSWKEVVAVELSLRTYLIGKLLHLLRRTGVRFVRENALAYSYPEKAVVYSYLSTDILQRLYEDQCLNGCLVISLTFSIPGIEPDRTWEVTGWQKRLVLYDFRTKPATSQLPAP